MQLSLDSVQPSLSFRVAGSPVAQGNKTIGGRRARVHGQLAVLNPYLVEQSDMGTKKHPKGGRLRRWRAKVATVARIAWLEQFGAAPPWDCACVLSIEFVFQRPAGDWLSPGQLRAGARAHPDVKPDLSKVLRAVEDALSGIVYTDDARVVRYGEMFKRYAAWGGAGGVAVTVQPL